LSRVDTARVAVSISRLSKRREKKKRKERQVFNLIFVKRIYYAITYEEINGMSTMSLRFRVHTLYMSALSSSQEYAGLKRYSLNQEIETGCNFHTIDNNRNFNFSAFQRIYSPMDDFRRDLTGATCKRFPSCSTLPRVS